MLAGILSKVKQIRAGLTDARMAALDKLNITGNPIDGNSYTSTRAAKLPNADTTVSSRAPASTAVSNATLTPARCAKLAHADALASTLLNATTGTVKRKLSGSVTLGGTYVIVSLGVTINLAKSRIEYSYNTDAAYVEDGTCYMAPSATDLTFSRFSSAYGSCYINWQVLEFN